MKKILSVLLCLLMLATLVSCGKAEPLKIGVGTYTEAEAKDASADADGKATATTTVAAITVDADGKIVACVLDAANATVGYTADGKAVANESFKTKREQGDDYNMKKYGKAAFEWYEQADKFTALVVGKTLDEVKALVAGEDGKGTTDVINAGCTITVSEFVYAIEDAFKNLVASEATEKDTLKLGVYTEQTCTDATENKNGSNKLETTFFAAAVNADGKIVAAYTDAVQVSFAFDATGTSAFDATTAITSKRSAGADYGMSKYGIYQDNNGDGVVKEWNEQAAIFDSKCVGKTVSEVASLLGEKNYGTSDLQSAGCTILVNGFVKAAAKIG